MSRSTPSTATDVAEALGELLELDLACIRSHLHAAVSAALPAAGEAPVDEEGEGERPERDDERDVASALSAGVGAPRAVA